MPAAVDRGVRSGVVGLSWGREGRSLTIGGHQLPSPAAAQSVDCAMIGGEIHATSPDGFPASPSLVWTGSEYGLAFHSYWRAPQTEVWITRLDATGNVVGEERQLANDMAGSVAPSLAWSDDGCGVAWTDVGEYTWPTGWDEQIRFARVVCGCLAGADPDNDSIGMPCDNCPEVPNSDQTDVDQDGYGVDCEWNFTAQAEWYDPTVPDAAEVLYYLHRPAEPVEGSWGPQSKVPYERDPLCLP